MQATFNDIKYWHGTARTRVGKTLGQPKGTEILRGVDLLTRVSDCALLHDFVPACRFKRTVSISKEVADVFEKIREGLHLQRAGLLARNFVDLLVDEQTVQSGT